MNNIGNIVELTIIDINHEGQGVAKENNFVYFVNQAVTGDKVQAKIIDVKKNFAICDVVNIIEKSEFRTENVCEYFPKCGGCQILNFKYSEQVKVKKNRVINDLKKSQINLDNVEVYDTLGMENPFNYRNKTAFSVSLVNNKVQIGTYEQNSHKLINIESCKLQDKLCDKLVVSVRNIFNKYKVEPYNSINKKGNVRHIVIRKNRDNEIMLIIVTSKRELANSNKIIEEIIKAVPNVKTIVQNINKKEGSMILGYENVTLYGDGTIIDYIDELRFVISPHTFFQVNPKQTEKLYNTAIQYADIKDNELCYDLYCGIGTISLLAAEKAKKVIGVEIVEQSIEDAKKNAKYNNINNTEFYAGKVETVLPRLAKKGTKPDVIIVDPPRKGCEKDVIKTMIEMSPKRIAYVSCNPATLARDIKLLEQGGYTLKKVQPVDMFCHSTHVETVVVMTKFNMKLNSL